MIVSIYWVIGGGLLAIWIVGGVICYLSDRRDAEMGERLGYEVEHISIFIYPLWPVVGIIALFVLPSKWMELRREDRRRPKR